MWKLLPGRPTLRLGLLLCLCVLPVSARQPLAQTSGTPAISDSAMQALFLYNFAKFVEWPEKLFADRNTPIRLCIYGEKPGELRQSVGAIEGKTAQGREIRVRNSATLSELGDCQIVFVPAGEKRWLPEVLRTAHGAGALTVSDMEDFIDLGGAVGLLMIDRQMRFEFNLDATQAAQLKVSAQVLKLARTVRGQGAKN